ncbi:MAG: hypothetical protein ACP5JP_08130 [bacterium]
MKLSFLYKLAAKGFNIMIDTNREVEPRIPNFIRSSLKARGIPVNSPIDIPEIKMGPQTNIDMANVEGAGMVDSNMIGGPIESAW